MTGSDSKIVAALKEAIVQGIGERRYHLWFERQTKLSFDQSQLTIGVPNRHFQEWMHKSFHQAIKKAAEQVLGNDATVCFVIDAALFRAARQEQEKLKARKPPTSLDAVPAKQPAPRQPRASTEPKQAKPSTNGAKPRRDAGQPTLFDQNRPKCTRRWHRLENFVVGPCNRVAHASALSIVEMPNECGNPLVLHGSVGTGKTHLLEGIYVGLRKRCPDWKVCFVTAEQFTNRFVQAMRQGRMTSFRRTFRDCDALLLDDLHFLAAKKKTQEEVLHTLDYLQAEGKPVVVTSDCHPRLSDELPPELIDRLLGGAVWGLTVPDEATRLEILKQKSVRRGQSPIGEEVLQFLASQLRGNARELEGALNSLRHYSRVTGKAIDVPLAREALADLLRHVIRVVQLSDVDESVCRVLRLGQGALQSRQRSWAVSHPRMLAMFLSRRHTSAAYSEIGQHFGGRNHSTAVAAEKKVRHWLESNGELTLGPRTLKVRDVIELVERDLLQ